jgi:hypothetical protein
VEFFERLPLDEMLLRGGNAQVIASVFHYEGLGLCRRSGAQYAENGNQQDSVSAASHSAS